MSPETPNILYAAVAILAGALVYFACKSWFWRQEALFNFQMWKNEEKHNGELFSQLCQLADRVRYEGEKKPEGFAVRPEEAAPEPGHHDFTQQQNQGVTNGTRT